MFYFKWLSENSPPKHPRINLPINIRPTQNHRHFGALLLLALFDQRRQTRSAGTFGGVVGVFVEDADRVGDFVIVDPDDSCSALADDVERLRQWQAAGHAVGEGVGGFGGDDSALFDALRKGVGVLGYDADDLGFQA
jgi:hypothetical protein